MARNNGFADIRTYDELEASIRLVQHQIRETKASKQVSGLIAGKRPHVKWTDVTLLLLRVAKRRLSR